MVKRWLSRLETVHVATTREELEAVYRFRYQVYFEEFGRELGGPDHDRKWVTDDEDTRSTTTILYTGSVDDVTGTVRLRHWPAGRCPRHDVEELSIDRFEGYEALDTAEIGRLMVRKSLRGRLIIASLLRASYELLVGTHHSDLVFCYCSPGLVRYYQQLAMRPFGGRIVPAPDGMMVPLVSVPSDEAYFREVRSLFLPLVREYFGPGKREPLDLAPYRHLFEPRESGVDTDPDRLARAVARALEAASAQSFLASQIDRLGDELLRQALAVRVPRGTLITRRGFRERELYVVLRGRFRSRQERGYAIDVGPGEVFGEDALVDPSQRRVASVEAVEEGCLLVLRGRAVERLVKRRPVEARLLRGELEELFAQRRAALVEATGPMLAAAS